MKTNSQIVGRDAEQRLLLQRMASDHAELIALYGRRRVGKTYLVKQLFKDKLNFYATGVYQGNKQEHLLLFNKHLNEKSGFPYPIVQTWFDAFDQLRHFLTLQLQQHETVIIFLDEFPWFDTPRSRFVAAFEHFWNSWASTQKGLKIIVCGSSTTWMLKHFVATAGGLHNRTTHRIHLHPFNLYETELFLKYNGIKLPRIQIVEAYMILGGIPYYLERLKPDLSLAQNIDTLFFGNTSEMKQEYNFLMSSLFKDGTIYQQVMELLAKKVKGFTRKEIVDSLPNRDSGYISQVLDNLIMCDFVRQYMPFAKKERDALYQMSDLYCLYYLRHKRAFNSKDTHYWSNVTATPAHNAWSEYAYEQVCLQHLSQIKQALGILGVQTNACSWVGKGAQIDLLLDRKDQTINLCEVKYSQQRYNITKSYFQHLQDRMELFQIQTKTNKALQLTMITTMGIIKNEYSAMIPRVITLDDLFAPER